MKIDSFIVTAQKEYIRDKKMLLQDYAAEMEISPCCVTKWSKVGNGITDAKWKKLFPKIKEYLPKDRIYIDDSGNERYVSATEHVSEYVFEPKYVPAMVPIIPFRQVVRFDNTLDSVMQFGQRIGADMVEYRPKHPNKSGVMAVKIEDCLFDPVLPLNTTLFIGTGGEMIVDGCLVIAKDVNNEVFIGKYSKRRDQFAVTDLMSKKPLIVGEIESPRKFIDWIFPVLYYEVVTF